MFCDTYKITIFNKSMICPPFPFSVGGRESFSIGNLKFGSASLKMNKGLKFIPSFSQKVNFHLMPHIYQIGYNHSVLSRMIDGIDWEGHRAQSKSESGLSNITVASIAVFVILCPLALIAAIWLYRRKIIPRDEYEVTYNRVSPGVGETLEEEARPEVIQNSKSSRNAPTPPKHLLVASILACMTTLAHSAPFGLNLEINFGNPCGTLGLSISNMKWCETLFEEKYLSIDNLCNQRDGLIIERVWPLIDSSVLSDPRGDMPPDMAGEGYSPVSSKLALETIGNGLRQAINPFEMIKGQTAKAKKPKLDNALQKVTQVLKEMTKVERGLLAMAKSGRIGKGTWELLGRTGKDLGHYSLVGCFNVGSSIILQFSKSDIISQYNLSGSYVLLIALSLVSFMALCLSIKQVRCYCKDKRLKRELGRSSNLPLPNFV